MEAFTGLAILTTNLRQNVDSAFLRRMRFVVEFSKPDAGARQQIWERCLDTAIPREQDLGIPLLARKLELSGGNIRQITLRAAFLAASENKRLERRHLFAATRAELTKLGQASAERELRAIEEAMVQHERAHRKESTTTADRPAA
jgi:SpoVK/Ycf46/Vps4 family AAA+-type ATPase